ncbi:PepSY-associated TM helix domain-containing protein [Blastopirellula sp. JC732]|uniref:PepSY-associated TM helix domain-containing protein n=1 Tax=Blastopirellula sediminis TaxID=2894196 RepID=A0A9X1SJ44_9BACT|nr:PepSY-associated TM helix domain-containing protein [Blastopirellula sediminis]MCC9604754.1 PepSY-associated TM helix domain-containing protein [Blastopirellula sediminis]MCC9631947.1 PepSY-associated TM helix domain-containing protein [Blastopirellula sediminis]
MSETVELTQKKRIVQERRKQSRAYWNKTMRKWHWISSAICLVGMIVFAVTGITLNHAGELAGEPQIRNVNTQVPASLLETLREQPTEGEHPLPVDISRWLRRELTVSIPSQPAEWTEDDVYLSMQGPGVDAWLTIDRESGDVEFERTSHGWIAYFNDLHKGRHTGLAWSWFLDIFAIATLIFCLTGLYLLYFHAQQRRMTWPLVGLGFVLPLLIAMFLMH